MAEDDQDLVVVAVTFGEQWLELTVLHPGGISPMVRKMQVLQVHPQLVADELAEVQATLREIVARALVEDRSPPDSFTGPRGGR